MANNTIVRLIFPSQAFDFPSSPYCHKKTGAAEVATSQAIDRNTVLTFSIQILEGVTATASMLWSFSKARHEKGHKRLKFSWYRPNPE